MSTALLTLFSPFSGAGRIEAWRGGIFVGTLNWVLFIVSKAQSRSSPKVKFDRFAALVLMRGLGVLRKSCDDDTD